MQYLRNTQFYKNLNGSRKMLYIYFVLLISWMETGESVSTEHLESTRSKRQVEERNQHCISYGCIQQGSFCKEVDGAHTCVCNRDCIQPNQDERICASNNQTYSSVCFMDRAACENGITILKINCLTTATPTFNKPRLHRSQTLQNTRTSITIRAGHNVVIPCGVTNLASHILWEKSRNSEYMNLGHSNGRWSVNNGGTLEIKRSKTTDSGTYTCFAGNRMELTEVSQHTVNVKDRNYTNLCKQPPVRGLCRRPSMRLYFDSKSGKCKAFVYGGCGGNANNFPHIQACEDTCLNGHPNKPSHICPFCSQHLARSYCKHDFVVTARVKRIFQSRLLQLQITHVFKDESNMLGLRYLNLTDPEEASNNFLINLPTKCPCPNLKRVLHSSNHRSAGWEHEHNCDNSHGAMGTGQQTSTSRRRRCTELILSGYLVYGLPAITEGSLAVKATRRNVARIRAIAGKPYLCEVIKRMEG